MIQNINLISTKEQSFVYAMDCKGFLVHLTVNCIRSQEPAQFNSYRFLERAAVKGFDQMWRYALCFVSHKYGLSACTSQFNQQQCVTTQCIEFGTRVELEISLQAPGTECHSSFHTEFREAVRQNWNWFQDADIRQYFSVGVGNLSDLFVSKRPWSWEFAVFSVFQRRLLQRQT